MCYLCPRSHPCTLKSIKSFFIAFPPFVLCTSNMFTFIEAIILRIRRLIQVTFHCASEIEQQLVKMASLKSFLQFHKDSQPRIIESRMVSLSSIFIAYIFFFRLARSNLVAAWAVCSYVVSKLRIYLMCYT